MNLNEIIEKLKSAKTIDDFILPYVATGKSLSAHIEEFLQTDTAKQFAFELNIRAVKAEKELGELKRNTAPQTKPLSDEEIIEIYNKAYELNPTNLVLAFAKEIEKAHKIA